MTKIRMLIRKYFNNDNLKAKVVRGSVALSIGAVFQRVMKLGRTMILARLLVPEDFGLIAITMMVVEMVQSMTDAGIRISIIQNKEGGDSSYLNAAWWFQAVRGCGLYSLTFILAPFVSSFYGNESLTDLIRVASLSMLLNGLVSPRVHQLERELRFYKWTLLLQISVLVGTIITIVLGYYVRDAWAIVLGTVIELFSYCLFSHILYPFRPNLKIDNDNIAELFKFARGIFGLSALNLIARQTDVFVLGKLVTPATLGSYYLALQLAEQPISLLSNIFPRVLLPVFAKMQENKTKLTRTFLSLNRGVALIGIPTATFIAINSSEILLILYGREYMVAGIALTILSVNIFMRAQIMIQTQAYFGLGLPHLHRRQSLIRSLLMVVLMYPAVQFGGVWGAALILLIANTTMLIFQLFSLSRILYFKPLDFFYNWGVGIGLGVFLIIPKGLLSVLKINSSTLQLAVSVGIMITVIMYGLTRLYKQAT